MTERERDRHDRSARQRAAISKATCPTCGNQPVQARARWQQRQDLAVVWLYADPARPGEVIERQHCAECQPHQQVQILTCPVCGDGPLIAGDLADAMPDEHAPPGPVRRWLGEQGWRDQPGIGLVCTEHRRHP